jgi:hypothetical protein
MGVWWVYILLLAVGYGVVIGLLLFAAYWYSRE